jgi:hypothetical protein
MLNISDRGNPAIAIFLVNSTNWLHKIKIYSKVANNELRYDKQKIIDRRFYK